jgi:hypothetical protein
LFGVIAVVLALILLRQAPPAEAGACNPQYSQCP